MVKYEGVKTSLNAGNKVVDVGVTLNSGHRMPAVGFGTYSLTNYEALYLALDTALQAGYRSFDTATMYDNEEKIGKVLKELLPKYNLKREDIFITSKLLPSEQGKERAKAAVEKSLRKLGLSYLDLYLIHWPGAGGLATDSKDIAALRAESWSGLVELCNEGKLKSAGVSNYTARHMRELLDKSDTPPAVNQVEYHPHWQQEPELFEVSAEVGTLLQSYSTLGGNHSKNLISDPTVQSIANKLHLQPAQVLLRWALQHGVDTSSTCCKIRNILVEASFLHLKEIGILSVCLSVCSNAHVYDDNLSKTQSILMNFGTRVHLIDLQDEFIGQLDCALRSSQLSPNQLHQRG